MNRIRSLFALFCFVAFAVSSHAADEKPITPKAAPKKTVRLVAIGNSFSNDATTYLDELALADGNLLIFKTASVGGSALQLHAERAELHERDPADAKGTYTAGKGLKEILLEGKPEFVTIQQASLKSHDVKTYQPYATKLRDYVKQYSPQAELLIHETWAYRVDDPRFSFTKPKEGEPKTQREMYEGLSNAYRTTAAELGIRMIPVGDAFIAADTDAKFGYKPDTSFDPKTAKHPELPNQKYSLHVGRAWKEGESGTYGLGMDGHHSSTAGRYLGACVWYEMLFDTSCVGNSFQPAGVDSDHLKFLQQTAHAVVVKVKENK
jgi:hypothetical protein